MGGENFRKTLSFRRNLIQNSSRENPEENFPENWFCCEDEVRARAEHHIMSIPMRIFHGRLKVRSTRPQAEEVGFTFRSHYYAHHLVMTLLQLGSGLGLRSGLGQISIQIL